MEPQPIVGRPSPDYLSVAAGCRILGGICNKTLKTAQRARSGTRVLGKRGRPMALSPGAKRTMRESEDHLAIVATNK